LPPNLLKLEVYGLDQNATKTFGGQCPPPAASSSGDPPQSNSSTK
jgi:hypothetical protein